MRVLVLLSVLVSTSHQICFPDEDLRECYLRQNAAKATTEKTTTTTTNETPVETIVKTLLETRGGPRRSLISGRYCFSTRGYSGHCQFPQDCPDRSYSYSRNCGWKHICCKDAVTKKATQRPTRTPTVRSTARSPVKPPVKRPSSSSPSETCGVGVTDLIFCGGGRNCTAGEGQFPFMVSFVYTHRSNPENFCGGALISRRHVLTAAHCFSNVKTRHWQRGLVDVRIGQNDITEREKEGSRANIASINVHPGYREKLGDVLSPINDIAVVSLDREVRGPGIMTVCLPDPAHPVSLTSKLTVAGWGANTTNSKAKSVTKLQFAELETTSVRSCQAQYSRVLQATSARVEVKDSMLCAGGGHGEEDTCRGDSGAPLFGLDSRYRKTVVGLVSFGPSRCGSGLPGVFTKVASFTTWIENIME